MRLLSVDTETTSADPATARIVEISAVLAEVLDEGPPMRWQTLETVSQLCRLAPGETVGDSVEIHGLTDAHLEEFGQPLPDVLVQVGDMVARRRPDFLIGHNLATYDLPVLRGAVSRMSGSADERTRPLFDLPVIDTRDDIRYPARTTCRKLAHLCAEHGFLVEGAHRAMADALATLRLAGCYRLSELIERAKSPTRRVQAVYPFDRAINEVAKRLGFHFEEVPVKGWWQDVKDCDSEYLNERWAAEKRRWRDQTGADLPMQFRKAA